MANNLKAERTLTAEELQDEFERIIREEIHADYSGELLGVVRACKAMASLALQSLSTQQPMGEVTEDMVERAARVLDPPLWFLFADQEQRTGEPMADIALRSGRWAAAKETARSALNAALHPNQESGE